MLRATTLIARGKQTVPLIKMAAEYVLGNAIH
jgi:hypothetical protein